MQELTAYAASLAIGLSLGLIGAGGSILTIPIFVYILHKDPLSSSMYSMFVVGICSLAGSAIAVARNLVDFAAISKFGLPSVAGVLLARRVIFPGIPSLWQVGNFAVSREIVFMISLAFLMAVAGGKMLQRRAVPADTLPNEDRRVNRLSRWPGTARRDHHRAVGYWWGFPHRTRTLFPGRPSHEKGSRFRAADHCDQLAFQFLEQLYSAADNWYLFLKFSAARLYLVAQNYLQKFPVPSPEKAYSVVCAERLFVYRLQASSSFRMPSSNSGSFSLLFKRKRITAHFTHLSSPGLNPCIFKLETIFNHHFRPAKKISKLQP